jgi:hypothetical protein
LLERNDGKKWWLWYKTGKLGSLNNPIEKNSEYFNKYDAMVEFESLFFDKTSNKWSDRKYF